MSETLESGDNEGAHGDVLNDSLDAPMLMGNEQDIMLQIKPLNVRR